MTWNNALIAPCEKLGIRVTVNQRFMFFPQGYVNAIFMPLFNHMSGNTSKSNIDKVQRLLADIVTNNFNNDIAVLLKKNKVGKLSLSGICFLCLNV